MRAATSSSRDHVVRFRFAEQGDPGGTPMLLLHGVTDSWRSWQPMLAYLRPELRAIAVTQRGHGDAERPSRGYRVEDDARDAVALMDAPGIEAAVVVGHSMGTYVAERAALDHPDRVLGLVLAGAPDATP